LEPDSEKESEEAIVSFPGYSRKSA
jgi:hypothetical protein